MPDVVREFLLALLDGLRVYLDPGLAADLAAYQVQRQQQQAQIAQLKQELLDGDAEIRNLGDERTSVQARIAADNDTINQLNAELERLNHAPTDALADLTNADVLRADL